MRSVEELLIYHAQKDPSKSAVIVDNCKYSYKHLEKLVIGFGGYLKIEAGIKKGDSVLIRATQSIEFAVAYFATHFLGAIAVPLEKNAPADLIERAIDLAEPKLLVGSDSIVTDRIECILKNTILERAREYCNVQYEKCSIEISDTADIMFTSGTTGAMKGVEVSYETILATSENYIIGFEMKKDDVMAVPGPLSHVNPLRKLYTTIVNGSTIVILNGLLSIKEFFSAVEKYNVNSLCLPPSALHVIWKMSHDKLSDYKNQIRYVECSTAPLLMKDKEVLRTQLPYSRLYNNYGLSECGAMAMYDFNRYQEKKEGCVGKAMKNSHVIILDEEGNEIKSSSDKMGVVANKGKINMKGYWKNKDLTESTIRNGYVVTNDIGYVDKEGFLYIMGRKNDTINIGGLKVEPLEVEEIASELLPIKECVCIAVPDELTENALKLLVVMDDDVKLDANQMRKVLGSRLEAHKVPRYYENIKSIPRNGIGKIDRKKVLSIIEKGSEN